MSRRWQVTGIRAGLALPIAPTPPGRDRLDWRLGRWTQFRAEMLARLRAMEVPAPEPERGTWQPYADLAVDPSADWVSALVDAWSEVGDILSFYQERLLNEGFLRTAREPASLDMLLGAVGARRGGAVATPGMAILDPGCAATAWFILTMHEGRGLPTRALLPAGSAIRHVDVKSQRPVLFETDNALTARKEWNALPGLVPPPPPPRHFPADVRGLRLTGTQPGVEPAAHLLLTGQGADGAALRLLRTVQSLTPLRPLGVTELVLAAADSTAGAAVDQPRLYAFDRQAALFGADAPPLDSLPRPRRLEQGIAAGGLFLLPPDSADLPDVPWQAVNQDIPTGQFTAVQPLDGGDMLLSTSDGLLLRTRLDAAWTPSRGGLTQRGLRLLCDDGKGGVLAGGPAGAAFRSDDPRRGWNSLAGGYVLDTSGKHPAPARAALPAEQVRRLIPVDTFPGGGGIMALTDSGLFLRRQAGAWLRVRLTRLLAGTDKDIPTRFADAVMGATGHVVAVCHDGGIERLGVKDAILPPAPTAAPDPATKAKPPASARKKGASLLRRLLDWLGHALMLPGLAGRVERQVGLAARTLWQATRREWQKVEAADGRLFSLGTRKPQALVPLSDRLGEGDLLVATDQGCVLYDQLDRLWEASTGLPRRKGGALPPVRQILGLSLHGVRRAVALVDPADDGTGGGVFLYEPEDRSWTCIRAVTPADGPALLGVSASGWLAFAQTPTPVAEWPGFALGGPAPPDTDDDGQPVLDLDAPGLALAPGSWLVLRDPDIGRIAALNVIRAYPVQANAFARNRRVCRALLDVPAGVDLADFPRRTSLVLAASRELPLAGGALTPPQPVGLTDRVCVQGLVTGLDDTGHTADAVPVREVPGARPTGATPPAGRQVLAAAKPVVLTGRPARVAPLLLGGVQTIIPGAVTRPARALTGYDLLALAGTQAALWALDAAGRLLRSVDQGGGWQPDAIGVPDQIAPITMAGCGDVLWIAGKGGVAWRRDGDAGWTPAPLLPAGYIPACLLPDGQGGVWIGGPSGLLALGGAAGWTRCGGGDLDPGAWVTALVLLADGTLAVGTDGDGVLLRPPGQPAWRAANDGLGSGRVTGLAGQGDRLLAGTADAGAWLLTGTGKAWQPVASGSTRIDAVLLTPSWLAVAGEAGLSLCGGASLDQVMATGTGLLGDLSGLLAPATDRILAAGRLRWTAIPGEDPLLLQQDLFDLPATEADLLNQGLVGPLIRRLFKEAQDAVPDEAVTIQADGGWVLAAGDWCRMLLPVPGGLRALRPGPSASAMAGGVDGQGRWTLELASADGDLCPLTAWPEELILRPSGAKDAALACVRQVTATDILDDGGATALTLDRPPGLVLDPDSVELNANVVAASQGESVLDEVLGNGDPDREGQQFQLRRMPLVFLPGGGPDARQSTLTVSVDGQPWQEVGDFAVSGSTDRCYRVIVDSAGRATILFGDGRHGARPPAGTGNIRASYRASMGMVPDPGPLNRQPSGSSSFSQIISSMAGLAKDVRMLLNSQAVPPEQASTLRLDLIDRAMTPAGRLITLNDHVRLITDDPDVAGALAAPGVGTGADARPLISVAPATGVEVGGLIERLRGELRAAQPVGGRLPRLLPARDRPVRLVASVWWTGEVPAGAADDLSLRLLGEFGAAARPLGRDLSAAEILAALQTAGGVAGAEILLLHPVGTPPGLCPLIAAHKGEWLADGPPLGAERVYLSDGAGHLLLRLAPARGFAPAGIDPVTGHG